MQKATTVYQESKTIRSMTRKQNWLELHRVLFVVF